MLATLLDVALLVCELGQLALQALGACIQLFERASQALDHGAVALQLLLSLRRAHAQLGDHSALGLYGQAPLVIDLVGPFDLSFQLQLLSERSSTLAATVALFLALAAEHGRELLDLLAQLLVARLRTALGFFRAAHVLVG